MMPPRQPTSWAGNGIHSGVETRFRIAHHLWHAAVDLAHHVKHQSSSRANGAPTDDHLHLFSGLIRCLVPAEQVNQTTSTFPSQNSRNPAFEAIVPNPFHYHGHLQVGWKLLPIPFNLSELPGFPTPPPRAGLHDSRPPFFQSSLSARHQHANRNKPQWLRIMTPRWCDHSATGPQSQPTRNRALSDADLRSSQGRPSVYPPPSTPPHPRTYTLRKLSNWCHEQSSENLHLSFSLPEPSPNATNPDVVIFSKAS